MIRRDPAAAVRETHDLLIIGGGIYGAALTLEAARRGLRPVLVERDDFGGATSRNSLRIVHGGLRYLQSLDFNRYSESVAERRWFLRHFPDLVKPLACLMPLYGRGLRRRSIFRIALAMNDWLSRRRNEGVCPGCRLPPSRVLTAAETTEWFPLVTSSGLKGAALWHDAVMTSSERLLIEILHWACAAGAICLNYVEAEEPLTTSVRIAGVRCRDGISGETFDLHAPTVVNCAGPWSRQVATRLDRDIPQLFRPSLAFNLFLDRPALSRAAVAVEPPKSRARTYFLLPWHGRVLAGTYHAVWTTDQNDPQSALSKLVPRFLDDLNAGIPEWKLTPADVLAAHAGLLPAQAADSAHQADREVLHDHGRSGGPRGLYSVSGVKYTTARHVAEKTLRMIAQCDERSLPEARDAVRPGPMIVWPREELERQLSSDAQAVRAHVRQLIEQEAVLHLDDLFLRRTDWAMDPTKAVCLGEKICKVLKWPLRRRKEELERLQRGLQPVF